jgi:hypothetical protein
MRFQGKPISAKRAIVMVCAIVARSAWLFATKIDTFSGRLQGPGLVYKNRIKAACVGRVRRAT